MSGYCDNCLQPHSCRSSKWVDEAEAAIDESKQLFARARREAFEEAAQVIHERSAILAIHKFTASELLRLEATIRALAHREGTRATTKQTIGSTRMQSSRP